jgi:hypothetical protein
MAHVEEHWSSKAMSSNPSMDKNKKEKENALTRRQMADRHHFSVSV